MLRCLRDVPEGIRADSCKCKMVLERVWTRKSLKRGTYLSVERHSMKGCIYEFCHNMYDTCNNMNYNIIGFTLIVVKDSY